MERSKKCDCSDIPDNTIHKIASVVVKDGKTLVVKKKGLDEYISLGGKHESGETYFQCLTRESLEELGVGIANSEFIGSYKDVTSQGDPIILDAYLVKLAGDPKANSEIEGFIWVSRDYKKQQIKLASILEKYIVPELINRDLM